LGGLGFGAGSAPSFLLRELVAWENDALITLTIFVVSGSLVHVILTL
jgi:hypothetical protein